MNIEYKINEEPEVLDIIEVYKSSGINRPVDDPDRISRMYGNSNLIVSAWDGNILVGVSRALTDYCYCCYLSDLAVKKEYQKKGIGKEMIRLTKEIIGDQSMLLLLAADSAKEYYPKL